MKFQIKSRSSIVAIIALIIGISGVGFGVYSTFFQHPLDQIDEKDISSNIVVGILDPDHEETVSNTIEIRAIVAGSNQYTTSVLRNGTQIGAQIPLQWNTKTVVDGWWNITVIATDVPSGNQTQDYVNVFVLNNPEENHIYYCSSQQEITYALNAIWSGAGTIIITENIILSNTITISGGGSYIIQGISPSITIDCNGDRAAFTILMTKTCLIKDLTLDAADLTTSFRGIIYAMAPSTYIQNVRFLGDSDKLGTGIYVQNEDTRVSNCYFNNLQEGISVSLIAEYSYISENTFINCSSAAITIASKRVICENNCINSCFMGIMNIGDFCSFSNNILYQCEDTGIYLYGDFNTFSGNSITGISVNQTNNNFGIFVVSGSDCNVFTGNTMTLFTNLDLTNNGYGMMIQVTCGENTVVGNTMLFNDINYADFAATTFEYGNNYI